MKALRSVLIVLALALIAGVGWRLGHPWTPPAFIRIPVATVPEPVKEPAKAPDPADARRQVLSRLGDAPTYMPFFDRLRAEFPGDYTSLVDRATASLMASGRMPNPERLMADALRDLRQKRGVLAAQAEAQPLAEIFAAQSAIVDTLAATDPALCADFLYGGSSPGILAFSAKHRDLLARLGTATLDAIVSGRDKHVEHEQPTAADLDGVAQALKAQNLSDDEIAALLDGKTFDPPLAEQRLCESGRVYLHVLDGMPPDVRLRVYALSAQLLARS